MINFSSKLKKTLNPIVLFLSEEGLKEQKIFDVSESVNREIHFLVKKKSFRAKLAEQYPLQSEGRLYLLVGVGGRSANFSFTQLRIIVRQVILSSILRSHKSVSFIPHSHEPRVIEALIEGVELGGYVWEKYKTEKIKLPKVEIVTPRKGHYKKMVLMTQGVNFARDLVNENADVKTASYLESQIRKLIHGQKNISLEVLGRKEMLRKGLRLHLAVNQASQNEPKLVIVKYKGSAKKENDIALVGKGVTFDTGGLNLKLSGHIETMKLDMGGAAAVIGTLKNIIELNSNKNILFVVGLAENCIGSKAYKPGDVLEGYSGKTVEIANTDAEGRLVLADAISYVVKNYKPKKIIDIATLTGACIAALGYDFTGLVATDEKMAKNLQDSAEATDDWVWRMPMYPELKDSVKSEIADIRSLGSPRGARGTITAAEFLRQFNENTPWAHLDIAGTSFVEGKSRFYFGHGATGAGVRLLTHYLTYH